MSDSLLEQISWNDRWKWQWNRLITEIVNFRNTDINY